MISDARAFVELHADAFARGRWDLVQHLWADDARLLAPTGEWMASDWPEIIADLDRLYTDVEIRVDSVFMSADQRSMAIEWTYSATRRADSVRSVTADAIIVDLEDGLVTSWREYFDLSTSVELGQVPGAAAKRLSAGTGTA